MKELHQSRLSIARRFKRYRIESLNQVPAAKHDANALAQVKQGTYINVTKAVYHREAFHSNVPVDT